MSTAVERAAEVLWRAETPDYEGQTFGEFCAEWSPFGLHNLEVFKHAQALADAGLLADGEARTQYGFRCTDECTAIHRRGSLEDARQGAANGPHRVVVRRTAIYGPWQEVSGDDA